MASSSSDSDGKFDEDDEVWMENKDGSKYLGELKDDKKHGNGVLKRPADTLDKNGKVQYETYEGQFEDDLENGHGTHTSLIGVKYEGSWKDGL